MSRSQYRAETVQTFRLQATSRRSQHSGVREPEITRAPKLLSTLNMDAVSGSRRNCAAKSGRTGEDPA
jgi:hypothetical protein